MLRRTRALISVMYAYMNEYRGELILWMLANSLPFILMGLWMEAATRGSFGMTPVDFARYFLAVFLVRQLTVVWVIWEFEQDVISGALSARLLEPLDPVWRYLAAHTSERFARAPFLLPLLGLFFALYPSAFWIPSWRDVGLTVVVASLAFITRFALQYTLSMLAFVTERASSAETLANLAFLFLSGVIAPLELFPSVVREVALLTPYPWMVYFPARILTGQPVELWRGLITLSAWGFIFIVVNRIAWRQGLKRYSAMGA